MKKSEQTLCDHCTCPNRCMNAGVCELTLPCGACGQASELVGGSCKHGNEGVDQLPRPKTLYITVGLPGSGKSTWVAKHFPDSYVMSTDKRLESFRGGYNWTFDAYWKAWDWCKAVFWEVEVDHMVWEATFVTRERRQFMLQLAKRRGWEVIVLYFDVPFKTCCYRNSLREPNRRVPPGTMLDLRDTLEVPDLDEGFLKVVTIHGK